MVALKSRTTPGAAVAQSLAALEWLLGQGCRQIVFKYCSTFDSTDAGNIGPVAEALADARRGETIVCPAFPGTAAPSTRAISSSATPALGIRMERHPLTPMRDPNMRRVLARQARRPGRPRAAPLVVAEGPRRRCGAGARGGRRGRRLVVVDATGDGDLRAIGRAARGGRSSPAAARWRCRCRRSGCATGLLTR